MRMLKAQYRSNDIHHIHQLLYILHYHLIVSQTLTMFHELHHNLFRLILKELYLVPMLQELQLAEHIELKLILLRIPVSNVL